MLPPSPTRLGRKILLPVTRTTQSTRQGNRNRPAPRRRYPRTPPPQKIAHAFNIAAAMRNSLVRLHRNGTKVNKGLTHGVMPQQVFTTINLKILSLFFCVLCPACRSRDQPCVCAASNGTTTYAPRKSCEISLARVWTMCRHAVVLLSNPVLRHLPHLFVVLYTVSPAHAPQHRT